MIYRSEKLSIQWDGKEKIKAPNRSGLFWKVFAEWWDIFPLEGKGLLVGENYKDNGTEMKGFFHKVSGKVTEVLLSDISNSDENWDITQPYSGYKENFEFNWIICQAVLEHVKDPVAAVRNLVEVLTWDGFLYIHSHGPEFGEHRHPIDCYRFLRDGVIALADLSGGARIVDMLYTKQHWFLLLQNCREKR